MAYKDINKRREYQKKWRRTEKRKKYISFWQHNHRDRINNYHRQWMAKQPVGKYKYKYKYPHINNGVHKGNCLIGRKFELLALKVLRGSVDCNEKSFSGKWDIEWNGYKVEVKSKIAIKGRYSFHLKNPFIPDYNLLFCRKNDKEIERIILLPRNEIKGKFLTVSNNKYKDFEVKFFQQDISQ